MWLGCPWKLPFRKRMDPARHVDAAMLPITCFISARLWQQSWWLRREEKKALEGSNRVEEDIIKPLNTWLADLHSGLIVVGEGNGTPLQCSCLENPMDGRAWWAAVHGVAKSRTRLSDFTFTFHFHTLEKEMATHSSVPAWRIPGTGEPGGLPSMGSHRVGHDWSDAAAAVAAHCIPNFWFREKRVWLQRHLCWGRQFCRRGEECHDSASCFIMHVSG